MTRILLAEDDVNLRKVLAFHLKGAGYAVVEAEDGEEALALFAEKTPDLVLTDVRMPKMDGYALLKEIRGRAGGAPVVVLTAYGTIREAVEAMKQGAADYLTKPVEREGLLMAVERVLKLMDLEEENRSLRERLRESRPQDLLLGDGPAMSRVKALIDRVASAEATVLITGESGTGKELAARSIHVLGSRSAGPFVAINCAAVPPDLLESELFGHVKGAFTGALSDRPGKFRTAEGGTVFLDEIGDMDLNLQAKLLRVLQERTVDPVGAGRSVPVDVRVLAATNHDLAEAMREGRFREDLYWRLNVIPLGMPPLRERPEDVPVLLHHFYRRFAGRDLRITREAEALLAAHAWPGNIRELMNLCQRLAVLHRRDVIEAGMLPDEMRGAAPEGASRAPEGGLWDMERDAIRAALEEHGGNRTAAARALKIPRHVLLYRLKKYGIP